MSAKAGEQKTKNPPRRVAVLKTKKPAEAGFYNLCYSAAAYSSLVHGSKIR
ncbi:hypothetical protein [Chimaeribacter coloradensis]|uniref:hypothetical protein n=1 Tax=Chimaeribacter coloradensis TaxID=2060068 RepID=UPI0013FCFA21|nr:hypothetical protein [Chimaeribacter coloradensis]